MVAARAGIAAGTVYLHFPDKDALLQAVLAQAVAQLELDLAEAAATRATRSAEQEVRQRLSGVVRFAAGHGDLAAVLFHPGHLATAAGADTVELLVASQAASLTLARSRGHLRADVDLDLAARALVGSLVQVMAWWVARRQAGLATLPEADLAAGLAELRLYGTAVRPRE